VCTSDTSPGHIIKIFLNYFYIFHPLLEELIFFEMSGYLISSTDGLRRPCNIFILSTSADAVQIANIALNMFSGECAGADMNIFVERVENDGCHDWHYTYDGSSFTTQMHILTLPNVPSASPLLAIDCFKFQSWVSTQTVPIIDGKVIGLYELNHVIDRYYQGFAANLVDMMKCKGSAVDIVGYLLIQGFRGTTCIVSKGKLIQMHERPQIISCDSLIAYGRKATQSDIQYHFRSSNDICILRTLFSDYRFLLRHVLPRGNVAAGAVVNKNEKAKAMRVEESLIKSLKKDNGHTSPTNASSSVDSKVEAIFRNRSKFFPRQISFGFALDRGDGTYDNDPSGQPTIYAFDRTTTTSPPNPNPNHKAREVESSVNIFKTVLALFIVLVLAAAVGASIVAVVVLALVGSKARSRACSSAQSRPSTPPLWSKVRILLATLLTLSPMVHGGCSNLYGTISNGHLTVPNTVTSIDTCKLVVV
jgi:hypothetical protein